jgi:hypothetical protein
MRLASTGHGGKQNLTFIGNKAFTAEGQVRSSFEGDHTVVEVNTTGTHGAEMQIQLDHHVSLAKADFNSWTDRPAAQGGGPSNSCPRPAPTGMRPPETWRLEPQAHPAT